MHVHSQGEVLDIENVPKRTRSDAADSDDDNDLFFLPTQPEPDPDRVQSAEDVSLPASADTVKAEPDENIVIPADAQSKREADR